jgi:predicted ester cyclase
MMAEGDKVVWRWCITGTHAGELMGIPPTGKSIKISGIVISRFANGKWAEDYVNWDTLGMLQQIGVVPAMA